MPRRHAAALAFAIAFWWCCNVPTLDAVLLPNPSLLPKPRQHDDRILVATTLGDIQRHGLDRLAKQLDHFVGACEAGFEIHVVIVTLQSDWESEGYLFAPGRNLCGRLLAEVPVALSVHKGNLAAQHRQVFWDKVGTYDFYMSHEDDVLYKAQHFQYFKHWSQVLRPAPLLHPGFRLYEVPAGLVDPDTFLTYTPAVGLEVWRSDLHLFKWHNHLLVSFTFGYDASYIITDAQLRQYGAYPAWLRSIDVPWAEFNVPFQGQWLANHVHRVVPVSHFVQALLHHTSNRYVNLHTKTAAEKAEKEGTQAQQGPRAQGLDAVELLTILQQCTDIPLDLPLIQPTLGRWDFDVQFQETKEKTHFFFWKSTVTRRAEHSHPCSVCLHKGDAAVLHFSVKNYGGSLFRSDNHSKASVADVHVTCSDALQRQRTHGCGTLDPECQERNETWWGPLLGPATSLTSIRQQAAAAAAPGVAVPPGRSRSAFDRVDQGTGRSSASDSSSAAEVM